MHDSIENEKLVTQDRIARAMFCNRQEGMRLNIQVKKMTSESNRGS